MFNRSASSLWHTASKPYLDEKVAVKPFALGATCLNTVRDHEEETNQTKMDLKFEWYTGVVLLLLHFLAEICLRPV